MTSDTRTVATIKGQMSKFSGIISEGLSKPKQKLIKEMIYGIQATPVCVRTRTDRKDIKLTQHYPFPQ